MRRIPRCAIGRFAGIGATCFWHSLIGVGAHNEPLTRVITWAARAAGRTPAALRDELGERRP